MWREVLTFFRVGFPVAVWRARYWWIAAGLGFTLVAVAVGAWVAGTPAVQASLGTPEEIRQLVEEDFAAYYSSDAAAGFAAQVWTNNAWVSALVLIAGAFFVLPAVYVLAQNAINVGIVGGLMVANGRGDLFFGLIAPHGLLELTAVFVAAGAGMRLGWQWFDPGPRPRSVALAQEGRAAVAIAMGLAVVLLVSGVIEAFVTPSPLPTWARIGIGALALGAFLAYVGVSAAAGRGPASPVTSPVTAGSPSWPRCPADDAAVRAGPSPGRARAERGSEPAGSLEVEVGVGELRGDVRRGGLDDPHAHPGQDRGHVRPIEVGARSGRAVDPRRILGRPARRLGAGAGSRTEATRTVCRAVRAGSAGSRPSSIAGRSRATNSTTRARLRTRDRPWRPGRGSRSR